MISYIHFAMLCKDIVDSVLSCCYDMLFLLCSVMLIINTIKLWNRKTTFRLKLWLYNNPKNMRDRNCAEQTDPFSLISDLISY